MDGIANLKQLPASLCYIHYYIDPVFHRFTEDNYIKYLLISQERLEIKVIQNVSTCTLLCCLLSMAQYFVKLL